MLMYVSSCNSPTKCGQWVADGKVGDGVSVRADGLIPAASMDKDMSIAPVRQRGHGLGG